ncbi:epimerase [Cystobacter fuscus]|uniref:Epimerase n=1 Tax=Cystobacter fuscus TaxID=43 RepID=A0A250JKA0_9BACT|nr:NAD-dependent epimerase/dehydratase family protein [Cystobacter fuscus]ATB44304.1 epimerase [Cystobacter fuscus]
MKRAFVMGVTGYIGGSVARRLLRDGYQVTGLVRTQAASERVAALGIQPILGDIENGALLSRCARQADVVINAANMHHRGSVEALLEGLSGTNKTLVHTSGSSIVSEFGEGEVSERIFEDDTPFTPEPVKAESVAINRLVLDSAARGVRGIVICPPMIYGRGTGLKRDSIQVPALIQMARTQSAGVHLARGLNVWSNVHIDDLVDLYALAIERAKPGDFLFAEAGEERFLDIAAAISRMLGYGGRTVSFPIAQAVALVGETEARYSGASNSRVRATRARGLGWTPKHTSLLREIEQGSYREDFAGPA